MALWRKSSLKQRVIFLFGGENLESKKTSLIYGLTMCFVMVFMMNLLETFINMGEISFNAFLLSFRTVPFVFLAAYLIQNFAVGKLKDKCINFFLSEEESECEFMLFNAIFIVTAMSLIMTVAGAMIAGEYIGDVLSDYFLIWPRNFCAAFFINIIFAGPISRFAVVRVNNKINE